MIYLYICKNPNKELEKFEVKPKVEVFNSRDCSIFDHIKMTRIFIMGYTASKRLGKCDDLVIFTDSDYVVRELSIMIILGEVGINNIKTDSILKEYNEYTVINKEDIKAFGLDGSEVKVDHMGIHAKDFDVIIDSQNEMQGIVFEEWLGLEK